MRKTSSWLRIGYALMLVALLVAASAWATRITPQDRQPGVLPTPASSPTLSATGISPPVQGPVLKRPGVAPAVAQERPVPSPDAAPAAGLTQLFEGQVADEVVEVETAVSSQINEKGQAGYLIYFRARPSLEAAERMSWIQRGRFVLQQLQSVAKSSQKNVRAYLDSQGVNYQSFWIDNVILVETSDATVFNGLKHFPEIGIIRDRRVEMLVEPTAKQPNETEALQSIEPNIAHVQAPEAWALGINGAGSVVSSIDTGVRYTHQALVGKYRGNLGGGSFNHNYNWWDPYGDHPTAPADDNGHGSHTMGTAVGDDGGSNQIGMAPGAKWIACRGCSTSSCTDAALLQCAQFIFAPWDLNQANPNPDLRPDTVNNSWGDCGQSYDPWYRGVVDSWRAAGIHPVFSNGNASNCGYSTPPACGTVGNPARYGNVTGVGATTQQTGAYATFSNRGPTDNADTDNPAGFPLIKPQVAAPGSNIRSSVNTSDSAYEGGWSGTSMAAPHVTGLTALIYQAAPCLKGNFVAIENILEQSAAIASGLPAACSGEGPDRMPNQATGWGEIRALAAVQLAATACGPTGTLEGTVTSSGGSTPIANAAVQAIGTERAFETRTDAAGHYLLTLPTGTYTLTVSAYGYMPANIPDILVQEGLTTTRNVALEAAPMYTVSGKVWDPAAGWSLYARITVDGYPGAPIWTDPATGNYSISLVAGQNYTFHAVPFTAGYLPAAVDTGVLTGDLLLDLPVLGDMNNCVAPGYALDVTGVYETFESATFPPAGWTLQQTADSECGWVGDDPGNRGNLTGGTGKFAIADSDDCGSGTTVNATLISPIMDVSSLANVNLSYNYDYNNLVTTESADLDVSADGGVTWTNVHHWATDMRGPNTYTQDVSAILGGSTQAQIRYHYIAPGWDWWWQVDNVFVGEKNCHPIAGGGLVVGRVADANDDHALIGAKVTSDTLAEATADATPDTAMGNFYALFQPAGDHTLTATMPGYSPSNATVTVPTGAALRQDFALQTGHLTYSPGSIDQTLTAGGTTTVQINVQNIGGGATTFSLMDVNKGAVPFTTPPIPGAPHTGLAISLSPASVKLNAGPWQPTGDISLQLDDGTMENSVGINSSSAAFQFVWFNRFTPDPANFPFTLDSVSVVWPSGQVAPGNAMQLVIYEDVDGDGDPTDAILVYSEDVLVQTANDTWNNYTLASPVPLTGPGDVLIGFVDRFVVSGVTPPNYPAALDETASAGRSWVGWWTTDPPALPPLPPDDTFDTIDDLGLAGNWMIRASGTTGGTDVPWLNAPPTQITLGAGENVTLDVTLDSTSVAPGVYTAELRFVHDTPYPVPNLPVRMVASIPSTMGKLAGSVTTNGYCDSDPAPLAGVPVTINSASFTEPLTLTTDANGAYFVWLDQSASPLTVDVNAGADYETGHATGVMLTGSQTTIQDFTLRFLQPCLTAAPPSILATIPLGTSTTKPLTLRNLGGAAATFAFENTATGYTPPASVPNDQTPNTPSGRLTFSGSTNPPTTSSDPNAGNARNVPAGSTTITQSNSQDITTGNSVSCNASGLHADNHYMRVFALPSYGISGDFTVTNVSFGIESSTPAGTTQPVEVRLYTLSGAFVFANLTPIGSATAAVTSQTLTVLDVPVSGLAPAGSTLVVDIFTPNGQAAGHSFFIGSNGLGETAPSYIAAVDCGLSEPATTASIGFPEMMIVMNVTGTAGGGMSGPAVWLSEAPPSGTVPSDAFQPIVVTFDSTKVNAPGTYKASATVVSNDPENQSIDVQTTMVVTAPANWGTLRGTINSLGHCDANPAPLSGAALHITGSSGIIRDVVSNAAGGYELWLPDYGSPYTIQATMSGWLEASASGVVVTGLGTTTQDLSLRWMQPCVTETPAAVSATVEWQQSFNAEITLSNSGAAATPFTISEIPGQFTPMGVTGNQILIVNDGGSNTNPSNAFKTAMDNLGYTYDAVNSSSSAGIPATMTDYQAVLYAGVPSTGAELNQVMAYLDAGGRLVIADNDFGYTDKTTALYQTYLQCTYVADAGSDGVIHGVDIMNGLEPDISSDPYPDSFTIGPDAIGIFANTAPRLNWAGMRIEREAYRAVYFAWDYDNAGGTDPGDAIETQILGVVMPWLTAADVDWLSESPVAGTLAANVGTQPVQVTLNSAAPSVLQPGTYTAKLKIETEDPENETIEVPVSMTVNPSPTYGKLWGIVRGLGACDLAPAPISGATVSILVGTDTIAVETDANGYYQYWFTAAYPTIGINVSATGHLGESRSIFFWPGEDPRNQEDFDLHAQQPCGSLTPDSLTAEVTMGESADLPVTIHNTGWAPLNFSFRGSATGFMPMNGTTEGEDVLLVASTSTIADAVAASLTRMGFTYNRVTTSALPPVETWTGYSAVIWAGSPSNATNTGKIKTYLDAGGAFLITYNDFGYFYDEDTLYTQYLEAAYTGTDAGSDGTITGADIMAGLNLNISADPYPDSFTITGPNAVAIFTNDAPKTDLSGLRIAKNGYKAIYLSWNFQYTGTTDAEKDAVLGKAMNWLAPATTWIQAVPASGTVAEQNEQAVVVTLTSSDPQITQPGTYSGELKMSNNTPGRGMISIPLSMVVNPPGTWGKLQGTVQGLGYCDGNPAPIANALVTVTPAVGAAVDLKTAADGSYSWWFDQSASPVTITVTATDHEAGSASATITGGMITTQDFGLRWLKPCSSVDPTSFAVMVPPDGTLDRTLTLHNDGAAATDWELVAVMTTTVAQPITTTPVAGAPHNGAKLAIGKAAGGPNTIPSTPPALNGTIDFVVDDGTAEDSIGVNDSTSSYQFIWMNRFTPDVADFPFNLEEVTILWPSGQVTAGLAVELVVYQDLDGDGDPTDAELMGSWPVTIQNVDGVTWDVYTLPDPLLLGGPGDILIGAINRWVTSASTPAQWPANIDTTASQSRSWIGWWNSDPPAPPALPPDNTWGKIDDLGFAGNWLIRASGTTAAGVAWLTVDPATGNLAADSQQDVIVHFNAAAEGIDTGVYEATLRYKSDDPTYPTISVPVTMTVGHQLTLTKTAAELAFIGPGELLHYTMVATNAGNVPLTNVSIADPKLGTLDCTQPVDLAPAGTLTCTGVYTTKANDLKADFTGAAINTATATGTSGTNTVTATATASVPQTTTRFQPPTSTCQQFSMSGAKPGLEITYTVKKNKISGVSPTSMTFFEKLNAATANFTLRIGQSHEGAWVPIAVANGGAVTLYNSNCSKSSALLSTVYDPASGLVTINVTGATPDTPYILGVKYNPNSLAGTPITAPSPTVPYRFVTSVDGLSVPTGTANVKVMPK